MTSTKKDQVVVAEDGEREAMARLREQLQGEHGFDVRMLTNRSVILGAGNPGMIGARLLENGIRYGAVLGIAAAQPFLTGTLLAFDRATKLPAKSDPAATVYDTLYERFLAHYGLFVAGPLSEARESPDSTAHFQTALASLTMAFTNYVGNEARTNPATFRTPEFASYALAALSLARLARLWQIAFDEAVIEQIGQIQLHKQHDAMRRALHAVVHSHGEAGEKELRNAFRATFRASTYKGVFVANLQFTHAYACSLAAFRGEMVSALTHLLYD
jgi:hypothetical protein